MRLSLMLAVLLLSFGTVLGDDEPTPPVERQPALETVVARGAVVEGRIETDTPVRVEGRVRGDLRVKGPVTVASSGRVDGDIAAHEVRIRGGVTGRVEATGVVEIAASGRIEGEVAGGSLVIEEGGVLEGQSRAGARISGETKENS